MSARPEAPLNPEVDVASLSLSVILDTRDVRLLPEDFRTLTGFGVALLDVEGRTVAASSPEDLCRHHGSGGEAEGAGVPGRVPPCESAGSCPLGPHACRHGLRNVESAVKALGRRFGTLFIGPFLFDDDPPTLPAGEGARDAELSEALTRVPRFRRESVGAAADFLVRLAGMLSTLSHGRSASGERWLSGTASWPT